MFGLCGKDEIKLLPEPSTLHGISALQYFLCYQHAHAAAEVNPC